MVLGCLSVRVCLRLLVLTSTVCVGIAGCARNTGSESAEIPYFGPRDPYSSPFKDKKVILTTPSPSAPSESDGEQSPQVARPAVAPVPLSVKLTAVANNACLETKCASDTRSRSLSCYLYRLPDRRKELEIQFYSFDPGRRISEEQLTAWVQEDACIIGVANENQYQSQNFNDTHITDQRPYLDTIRFIESQSHFTASNLSPVRVAVIDSGVGSHPDLGEAGAVPGVEVREDYRTIASKQAADCADRAYTNDAPINPHGTFVGGIIGARSNNTVGIAGIAQNAQIVSITVGDCKGRIPSSEIGNALMFALQNRAEVVNMSFGGATQDDPAIRMAITSLLNSKAVIVAAAGNAFSDLSKNTTYPAAYARDYPGFITVGWGTREGSVKGVDAVNVTGNCEVVPKGTNLPTQGSNYGPAFVKIVAPGDAMVSTMVPSPFAGYGSVADGYGRASGSSFSSPVVSGAAVLAVGYLKKNLLSYDERLIEYLVVEKGVNKTPGLDCFVRNGAILDLQKLGATLKYVVDSGETPRPIELGQIQSHYDATHNEAFITFNSSWNLQQTHYGARLGIFDGTCGGYSEPCRIQDFSLEGNSGTRNIRLSRNELLPMIADLSDPDFNLFINVAIYYPVINPVTGKPKSNFGVDAIARVNVRDVDTSNASSPIFGEVTNIRTDMQFLYVQGWGCLQSSNRAIPVELLDDSNVPISASFAYIYPYMVPHGTPIDLGSYSTFGGPFVATGITTGQKERTLFKAGLEASPVVILPCRTLTASHGFEFAVPLAQILNSNLSGKRFSIRVSSPNTSTKMVLKDAQETALFTFPEVNFQTSIPSNLSLRRVGDGVSVTGTVCSASPSPMQMELSFSIWDFRCRLKRSSSFPNFDDACSLIDKNLPLPLVHDPALTARDQFAFLSIELVDNPVNQSLVPRFLENLFTVLLTPAQLALSQNKYPVRWPNTAIDLGVSDIPSDLADQVLSKNLVEVASGVRVAGLQHGESEIAPTGTKANESLARYLASRTAVSTQANSSGSDLGSKFWDYYDVGEPYTYSVIAYSINPNGVIGEYLSRTYRVVKLMREVKKYETPLGYQSQPIGLFTARTPTPVDAACPYRFSFDASVEEMVRLNPKVGSVIKALLGEGESQASTVQIDTVAAAMREVPLDIRLFQDGVMLQHLLSDYGTSLTRIKTLNRGGP